MGKLNDYLKKKQEESKARIKIVAAYAKIVSDFFSKAVEWLSDVEKDSLKVKLHKPTGPLIMEPNFGEDWGIDIFRLEAVEGRPIPIIQFVEGETEEIHKPLIEYDHVDEQWKTDAGILDEEDFQTLIIEYFKEYMRRKLFPEI